MLRIVAMCLLAGLSAVAVAQVGQEVIQPTRPILSGQAPEMRVKLVESTGGEKVYAVVFRKGDEMLSGLTDFAKQYHVMDAHFTGIGAVSAATVGWLDLSQKNYHPIQVNEQVEVLAMTGDIATFNGNPVVHAHLVLGRRDGSTVGGHMWEAHVNPTVEVFVTAHETGLEKVPDDEVDRSYKVSVSASVTQAVW